MLGQEYYVLCLPESVDDIRLCLRLMLYVGIVSIWKVNKNVKDGYVVRFRGIESERKTFVEW